MIVYVREAKKEDLPEILAIENKLINLESESTLEAALANPSFKIFVAEGQSQTLNKKAILGYVEISTMVDESEIISIAVDERFQNKKIGFNLFQMVLKYVDQFEIKRILLDVKKSNSKAIGFYNGLGFSELTTRKNYYKNPDGTKEDALVLVKAL